MPQVRKLPGYMIIMDFGRHRVYLLGSFLHLLSSSLGAPTHELTTAPLNAMNLVFEMPPRIHNLFPAANFNRNVSTSLEHEYHRAG